MIKYNLVVSTKKEFIEFNGSPYWKVTNGMLCIKHTNSDKDIFARGQWEKVSIKTIVSDTDVTELNDQVPLFTADQRNEAVDASVEEFRQLALKEVKGLIDDIEEKFKAIKPFSIVDSVHTSARDGGKRDGINDCLAAVKEFRKRLSEM